MTTPRPMPSEFRNRLRRGEALLGTFMKVPDPMLIEVLGAEGFDFVMLDEEHAPWGRSALSAGLLAARAYAVAGVVRIARPDAASVLSCLDAGATGVMCPHVDTSDKARDLASSARYFGGTRGVGLGRGADYGTLAHTPLGSLAVADERSTVIAMIEDASALDVIDDIASVEGIDAIFLGRGDLALSLRNAGDGAPSVTEAVEHICASARTHGKALSAVVNDIRSDEADWLIDQGVTALMVSSDVGFVQKGARVALAAFGDVRDAMGRSS